MADGEVLTVEEYLTAQLLKKESELTNLRKLLTEERMNVARLQGVLSATRAELHLLRDEREEEEQELAFNARADLGVRGCV